MATVGVEVLKMISATRYFS